MTITALSIAGSDPSGGAGIQADLKTFSALGAYGMTVITALTAQSTQGVTGVHVVPTDFVKLQLDTVLADIAPTAVKIGMLATTDLADLVGQYLPGFAISVLDPVMVATSGDRLLSRDAEDAVRRLIPLASLITPNISEAAVLLDTAPATTTAGLEAQARALLDLGAQRVLLKGGHLDDAATDVYTEPGRTVRLTARRVATTNTHGTGCTLSSAIAALRPVSADWVDAVAAAKEYLTGAIAAADGLRIGSGNGPVHHFFDIWERA
ncbi:bifunctional hydroxymethylpyrimidine kinase/phosphomethylpyrimidine kinase [Propionicicella superfundia]|uniref:bifunctional hydroxymethylpyrimidine kinase/phosphomethylpyrimidine kinase n=1 Tax=Propionicicella superfundia TaxID=348582 RepID=UPI0003FFE3EE|nr:bifunctional hydroxymethylpyrimidine kinase/phosphomethylpyrimidine kinase [Propionicicella superfundia]